MDIPSDDKQVRSAVVDKLMSGRDPHSVVFEPAEFAMLKRWAMFMIALESVGLMAAIFYRFIKAAAPALSPRLWYGMPAYAREGNVVCFFQDAAKFKARYATLGFSDKANLDDGAMWPSSYALTKLTAADEARIAVLVKKAAS